MLHLSKMEVVAHAMTVVTCRGVHDYLPIFTGTLSDRLCADFDEILACACDVARSGRTRMFEVVGNASASIQAQAHEAVEYALVGWSPKEQAMKGATLRCETGSLEFAANPIGRWRIHGGESAWGPLPVDAPDTAQQMETVARWQVPRLRAKHPDAAVGGYLLMAELTPESVSITRLCDLDTRLG